MKAEEEEEEEKEEEKEPKEEEEETEEEEENTSHSISCRPSTQNKHQRTSDDHSGVLIAAAEDIGILEVT